MANQWKKWCPLIKGTCINGFSKGIMPENEKGERETCAFFVITKGMNPQTGQEMDDPGCSIYFMPILQIEVAQKIRQATASTDKVATEVAKHHATAVGAMSDEQRDNLARTAPRMLEVIPPEPKKLDPPKIGSENGNSGPTERPS